MSNRCPDMPTACSQEGPETWYGLTSYALQINCISPKFPISTRLPSTFIPACSFPEANMADVHGGRDRLGRFDGCDLERGRLPEQRAGRQHHRNTHERQQASWHGCFPRYKGIVRHRGRRAQSSGLGGCQYPAGAVGALYPTRMRIFTQVVENHLSQPIENAGIMNIFLWHSSCKLVSDAIILFQGLGWLLRGCAGRDCRSRRALERHQEDRVYPAGQGLLRRSEYDQLRAARPEHHDRFRQDRCRWHAGRGLQADRSEGPRAGSVGCYHPGAISPSFLIAYIPKGQTQY